MADLLRLGLMLAETLAARPAATPISGAVQRTALTLVATATAALCIIIAAGLALTAAWIALRPHLGPWGTPLALAGTLLALAAILLTLPRMRRKPAPPPAPPAPLAELTDLIKTHKAPALIAALILGAMAGQSSRRE